MKIIYTLFSFIILSFSSRAQQYFLFPQTNATWHYDVIDYNGFPPVTYYYDYTTIGDTAISTLHYVKVFGNSETYLFRQDSAGHVYVRCLDLTFFGCTDSSELLAYDFSLHLNDSIYIHNCKGDSVLCTVTHSDSVLTSVGYRKRLSFYTYNGQVNCNTDSMVWIESIGSQQDLFYNLNFYIPTLVCLQQYNFLSLDTPGQIIFIPTGIDIITNFDKSVFIDQYNILHSSRIIDHIEYYDLYGRKLFDERPLKNLVPLQQDFLANSIYLIRISANQRLYSIKFLKQ